MWCWSEYLKVCFRGIDYLIITLAVACICQWNRLTDAEEDALNCPADLKDVRERNIIWLKKKYVNYTSKENEP